MSLLWYNTGVLKTSVIPHRWNGRDRGRLANKEQSTMNSIPSSKACSKCGQVKPLSEFHKNRQSPDGLVHQCKTCRAEYRRFYYQEKGHIEREQNRKWKEDNYEYVLEYARQYGRKNYAKIFENRRDYRRSYYLKNKKSILARNRRWAQRNPDKVYILRRRHRINNPESIRAAWHRFYARKKAAPGSFTAEEWDALCRKYGRKCLACGKKRKLTVDHVVALSNGGTNDISNIQPLCGPCNSSKGAQTIDYRY